MLEFFATALFQFIMSSTRKNSNSRNSSDYYVTPQKYIDTFLENFHDDWGRLGKRILDPCAGGDKVYGMPYPSALEKAGYKKVITLDIRPDSRAKNIGDFLLKTPLKNIDCIITNPPFALALPIIKKSLAEVNHGGFVIMLLRLNFFGSKLRKPFFDENMPIATYVHHNRISFSNTKGTDSIEYMHCVWQNGYSGNSTALKLI